MADREQVLDAIRGLYQIAVNSGCPVSQGRTVEQTGSSLLTTLDVISSPLSHALQSHLLNGLAQSELRSLTRIIHDQATLEDPRGGSIILVLSGASLHDGIEVCVNFTHADGVTSILTGIPNKSLLHVPSSWFYKFRDRPESVQIADALATVDLAYRAFGFR